jgi:membrane protein
MVVQAVFFDIDGTLVDSNEFHVRAWEEAFLKAGYSISRPAIRKQIGKGADMLIPSLLPGSDENTRRAIAAAHGKSFNTRYLSQVRAFPGASSLVRELHTRGKTIVLASSAAAAEVEYYAQLLEIEKYLTATTSADDVENSKPAGDIFASALKKAAPIPASETVAVGDTPYDVTAAAQVGIQTIAVLSGRFELKELQHAGAIAVYGSVQKILDDLDTSALVTGKTTTNSALAQS